MMHIIKQIITLVLLLFVVALLDGAEKKERIPVKVAVITMYEIGD